MTEVNPQEPAVLRQWLQLPDQPQPRQDEKQNRQEEIPEALDGVLLDQKPQQHGADAGGRHAGQEAAADRDQDRGGDLVVTAGVLDEIVRLRDLQSRARAAADHQHRTAEQPDRPVGGQKPRQAAGQQHRV